MMTSTTTWTYRTWLPAAGLALTGLTAAAMAEPDALRPQSLLRTIAVSHPTADGKVAGGGGCAYIQDDGTGENATGVVGGGNVGAAVGYATLDGCTTLTSIQVAWGPVTDGQSCTLQIYIDPNKDGDPSDITTADQLVSVTGVVANPDTDTFNDYPIPPTVVEGMFWVVAITEDSGDDFPAQYDDSSAVLSPLNYLLLGISNLNDPFGDTVLGPDDTGEQNYMVRAIGDGTVVSCFGGDTNGDCAVNVTDLVNVINTWGSSGIGSGFNADLNKDGTVDVTDLVNGVINNWGSCTCVLRACCFEDGTCADVTLDGCLRIGGAIQGPGSDCAGTQCVNLLGACCLIDGSCQDLLPSDCTAVAGNTQGAGSSCAAGDCDPESNDLCADAAALNFGQLVSGTTENATDDPEAFTCNDDAGAPQTVTAPGNWYTVVGNGNSLTASMCSLPNSYDAKMLVYCGESCDQLFCLTANDDGCQGAGTSEATWCSENGQQYYILITGFDDGTGPYELVVNSGGGCGEPTQCLSDDDICEFATPIGIDQTVQVETCSATIDTTVPDCGQGGQNAGGRWLVAVGDGSTFTVEACNGKFGNWNSRLSVYCGPCSELECAGNETSNNASCGPFTEQFSWCTQVDREYYILISGSGADCGTAEVTLTSNLLTCTNPPCQPVFGACCTDNGATCIDGLEFEDCEAAPGKWFLEQLCADVICQVPLANDFCQTAIDLGSAAPVSVDFDNTNASSGPDGAPEVTCNPFGDSPGILSDLWYNWTAPSSGVARIYTCDGGLDTKLVVYQGAACPVAPMSDIGCSDDDCGSASELFIPITSGESYTIRVGGWGTDGGGQGAVGAGTLFVEIAVTP